MASYELNNSKWGQPAFGVGGGQVTWSFGGEGASSYAYDRAIVESGYQSLVRAAFQAWEDVANIDFVEVSYSASADILLGWDYLDGPSGTVGEATWWSTSAGPNSVREFTYADIAFDTAETWTTNPNATNGTAVNFYATALHEIGHALGLAHTADANTIMYAYTNDVVDLTPGDIAGAQAIYGATSTPADPYAGTPGADLMDGTAAGERFSPGDGNDTVNGNGGNDTIYAGVGDTGNDRFNGGDGDDIIGGGAGSDTLGGQNGNDTLFGGIGNDVLNGDAGADVAWAGAGDDTVSGGIGNDVLGGGAGQDSLQGNDGNDILYGADGNDFLDGLLGQDTLFGGAGNDRLWGGGGNDLLFNGAGADQVHGGAGNDTLWGGADDDDFSGDAGDDLFAFDPGTGQDEIADFELSGGDVLDVQAFGFTDIADVLDSMSNGAGGAVLTLGGGDSIVFAGLAVEDFAASARAWVLV